MDHLRYLSIKIFIAIKIVHTFLVRKSVYRRSSPGITDVAYKQGLSVKLPKSIFIFWAQGEDKAPEIVRLCINSWRELNPGWEVLTLSEKDVEDFVSMSDVPADLSWAAYSDILRVRILRKYGGVWVDATVLCERPLDDWLPEYMSEGFFAFHQPHLDREIASWFIAANRDSPLILAWDKLVNCYWSKARKPDAYLWLHYIFEFACLTHPDFRSRWKRVPKIRPSKIMLANRFITCRLPKSLGPEDVFLSRGTVPLSKLTYKHNASLPKLRAYLARGSNCSADK